MTRLPDGTTIRSNGGVTVGTRQPGVVSSLGLGSQTVYLGGRNYAPSYRNYGWYNGYWNLGTGSGGYPRYGTGYRGYNSGLGGYGLGGYGLGGYGLGGLGGYGLGGSGLLGGLTGMPLGWGLGGWGLGRNYYTSGYLPYANPYYAGGGSGAYDYSQPIPVSTDGANGAADDAARDFDAARQQFRNGDYNAALALVDRALSAHPSDAVLHEFRALVLFAQGDYQAAAATLHSVLAVGPGWDWATMIGLYPDVETYTSQLRALEANVKNRPGEPAARFVLAYLYITARQEEAAAKQLQEVVRLMPSDRTAGDLHRMLAKLDDKVAPVDARPPTPAEPAPADAAKSAPPLAAAAMTGTWHASRDDGSKFDLVLSPDKQFVWDFSQDSRHEKLSGTFTTEGSLLVLQPKEAGAMIGQVKMDGKDNFSFRLLGAPAEDKGLAFAR